MDIFETFLISHWKDVFYNELTVVIKSILEKFTEALTKNPLLPLEIIFQFQNKVQKDYILSNYEETFESNDQQNSDDEDMDWIEFPKEKPWNEDDDNRLVDLYELYS